MKDYIGGIVDARSNSILNPGPNPGDTYPRAVGSINKLIVHHEAQERPHDYDSISRYESEAYYQNGVSIPGSRGIQYHYHIDNTGVIFWMRDHNTMLWNCGSYPANQTSIAICMDGNMQDQLLTQEQAEALRQLLDWLSTQHPEFPAVQADVYPHQSFSSTACCGTNLVPWVNSYRGGATDIAPNSGYDWPEYQPSTQPVPSLPTPPIPTTPDYITNALTISKTVEATSDVNLTDLTTNTTIKVLAAGTSLSIGSQTTHNGQTYYISVYSTQKGLWQGVLASQVKDMDATTPVGPATPTEPNPDPNPGTTPVPTPVPAQPTLSDLQAELGVIRGLIEAVLDWIHKTFK